MGTIFPFDSPLGSLGRPGFLVFFVEVTLFSLLYDGGSYGCFRRYHGRDVQHGHKTLRLLWIVGIVSPRINSIGSGMTSQFEDLHHSVPNDPTFVCFCHWDTLNMRGLSLVQFVNHVP